MKRQWVKEMSGTEVQMQKCPGWVTIRGIFYVGCGGRI